MKKIIAIVLLCVAFALIAKPIIPDFYREYNKPIYCNKLPVILQDLTNEPLKQDLYWSGTDVNDQYTYALFINSVTGMWTIIQFNKDLACVIGGGKSNKFQWIGV